MGNDIQLYDFNSFSEAEKASALWENGVFLADIQKLSFKTLLYSINDFYVEAMYDGEQNKIIQFRVFKNTLLLEPYLDQIDISSLLDR